MRLEWLLWRRLRLLVLHWVLRGRVPSSTPSVLVLSSTGPLLWEGRRLDLLRRWLRARVGLRGPRDGVLSAWVALLAPWEVGRLDRLLERRWILIRAPLGRLERLWAVSRAEVSLLVL